jgi:hypothetical protein
VDNHYKIELEKSIFSPPLTIYCILLKCHMEKGDDLRGISHSGRWSRGRRIQQFDLWRAKVCPLDLYTRLQKLKDNSLQNVYMVAFFVSFDTKSLSTRRKFVQNIYGNPNSSQDKKLSFQNIYKLYDFYISMDFYLVF